MSTDTHAFTLPDGRVLAMTETTEDLYAHPPGAPVGRVRTEPTVWTLEGQIIDQADADALVNAIRAARGLTASDIDTALRAALQPAPAVLPGPAELGPAVLYFAPADRPRPWLAAWWWWRERRLKRHPAQGWVELGALDLTDGLDDDFDPSLGDDG